MRVAEFIATRPADERRTMALWALAMGLVALLGLGLAPLFDVDEGAFSEATREMLASGDWGHTTLNGEPRFDKPILIYWLQAASVQLFGLNEAALRLPSGLATWAWMLAVAAFAWPRWGQRAAMLAGTVLGTSAGVLLIGRAATADALLNLWLALTALELWRHAEGEGDARGALRRAALWCGLGVLTKGPVALLVPGAALLLWMAFSGRAQLAARLRALLGDGWAWLIFAAVALPWYAYALHRHGMAFVDGFLLRHNLQRYGGSLEGHGGSLLYYVVLLPLLMLPWTPLLVPLLARLRATWREPLGRYLLLWAGFVLVFFSFSGTKLPHYVLYGFTPVALLAGREAARWLESAGGARWGLRMQAGLLAIWPAAAVAVTAWIALHTAGIANPLYRALIGQPAALAPLGAAALVAVIGVAMLVNLRRLPASARWSAAGVVMALVMTLAVVPWWGRQLQAPVREAGQRAAAVLAQTAPPAGATLVQWGLHLPSVAVYARREAPRRPPRPGDLALAREDQIDSLASQLAALPAGRRPPGADGTLPTWQPLMRMGGMVLLRWNGAP
ncbi:4-amino-4-deoxy-L-arabinose transferase-like glycosyltransferase [Pseudacidovorax intermedius]|uniref:4-amino-4-deoxy-L-arabinose transferase-like glycosyltransferase n=1 Tax=Pseudacidovorax intermedius TaxID=433924 RepID=A0A370FJB4_9BURK|nr:4-amino-4-deoxy-L-arabinose transferase-like glycosyltransferase [Pseudacidovorax intermedius]